MAQHQRLNKRNLIKKHVAGQSFVDIGGLWGTTGEMVTTAVTAGASRAVMADLQAPGGIWWQKFEAHCAERGVEGYEEMQVDICAPEAPEVLGTFDFVHCSGVMYHVADLFRFVGNLVSVADKYLLLSSVVMPSEIRGTSGTLSFGPDNAFLTPLLSEANQQVIGEYLTNNGLHPGWLDQPTDYLQGVHPVTGPWWWLYSGEFMSRLVALYGLEILAEGQTPNGKGYSVFARVRDTSSTTST